MGFLLGAKAKLLAYGAAALAVLGIIAGIAFKLFRAGQKDVAAKVNKKSVEQMKEVIKETKDVEDQIRRGGAGAARDFLRRRLRAQDSNNGGQ